MTNTYKLILQSGPDAGKEYALEKNELYLGRDANNDVVVNDPEVSRRHARLVKQGDDYFYEDLGSTNGSFILGQRLATLTMLHPGAILTIGERVIINYVMISTDPSATVASPRRQVPVAPPPVAIPPAPPVAQPVRQVAPPPTVAPIPPAAAPKKSKAAMVIIIVIAVILVFCIIPWIIMEVTDSYCSLMPGIFNVLQAGSCS